MARTEEHAPLERSRTILVVEDNDINREMLCHLLQDSYQVIAASNGQEGIDIMQQRYEDISLILLDIFMPVLDGFDFLRFCRADDRYKSIPVIVTTASQASGDELECLKLGANDFVRKPYDPAIILNRVSNTIMLRESASIVNQLRWDGVTNLYRKEFFITRVEDVLAAHPDQAYDMVVSDIRNFKMLNERYGRQHCDQLLFDLANSLTTAIPGIVASGRIDGDVFAFLVEHSDADWTSSLNDAVHSVEGAHLHVRFGIVENVDYTLPVAQMCGRAATAIDQLRDSTGASVARYDESLHRQLEIDHIIAESARRSLEEYQLVVYYQPKHNVHTEKVAGAEALVRWFHPDLGLLQPSTFIPVFERIGMITQLDRYVLDEACGQIARLQELGLHAVPISVNMSPLDFDDPDLVEHIVEIANRHGIDHSLLHLELTETAYAEDPATVAKALRELREHGFKIELDDFGSGYSSLALLNTLPIDILKIDGHMVRQAARLNDYRIIQSAIHIAQLLNLETVIEGVETADALDQLCYLGCDLVQGFFYSWPLRQKEFEEYLENN